MPRFQFSLRTLLIVVTLLAIPCWYMGSQYRIVAERRAVLAKVVKSGGGFYTDSGNPTPTIPWIRSLLGDEGMSNIVYVCRAGREVHAENEIKKAFPEASLWIAPAGY
jgi:hypothetical protein